MIGGLDFIVFGVGLLVGIIQRTIQNGHEFKMAAMNKEYEDVKHARSAGDDHFKWTRRTIAIIATLYIFVGPYLAMFYGYPSFVSYPESNGWFWSIFNGEVDVVWKQLPSGYILFPIQQYAFELIIGLYFGKKVN